MINIRDLVENKDKYLEAFENKGYSLTVEIEQVIEINEDYLSKIQEENETRSKLNLISKEIGKDPQNSSLKTEAQEISNSAKELSSQVKELKEKMEQIASYFPQLPSSKIPVGKSEEDNVVEETFEGIESKNKKPHWDIIEEKKLILSEEAGDISGTRHVIYNGKGAQLVKAVEKLMIDTHHSAGYEMVEPPVLVNKNAVWNTGQLPKFEDDLFKVGEQYLIPTAEVPVTNIAAGKMYKEEELPIKLFASTSCFRKEAGSAGRDTRGLTRLHQFRKVELIKFGKAADEEQDFNEMLKQASKILDLLNIKYRYLTLCTGDMSFASRNTVDIEVWMPGQDRWVEISSVSSIGDFQSRRMQSKVKVDGKKELIYTYNGSGLAIGRTIAAIIENYYNEETNEIEIPEVLQKYLDFEKI